MKKLVSTLFLSATLFLVSCGENKNTNVVESGTYSGVAEEVEVDEKEIYVKTEDDKLIELYFTDETKVLKKDGSKGSFEDLKEDGKVEVTVEKEGNKNVPITVQIK